MTIRPRGTKRTVKGGRLFLACPHPPPQPQGMATWLRQLRAGVRVLGPGVEMENLKLWTPGEWRMDKDENPTGSQHLLKLLCRL